MCYRRLFTRRLSWFSWRVDWYLATSPRIRNQMGFETDRPRYSQSGSWLYYDNWPDEWKSLLVDFCVAYERGNALPMANPLPLAGQSNFSDTSQLGYRSVEVARDIYLAQVAHVIWLEITGKVPWRLNDWSDDELSYLLSSKVCFSAYRNPQTNLLYYVVYVGSRNDATENILGDPRTGYQFLLSEPEESRTLIGATPGETCKKLSGWFHDYLWHNPGWDSQAFHRNHPLLSDRLRRHDFAAIGNMYNDYVTPAGCGSASCLFADLVRTVNIPIRKVNNIIESFSGTEENHSGLLFDWQGGTGSGRYLLHTDDLYDSSYHKDPAPTPKDSDRGVALWEHVWLNPGKFGERFSYDPRVEIFGKATSQQKVKYNEIGDWLTSSAQAILVARITGRDATIAFLQSERDFTRAEAEECWAQVEASVLAYGDGDMTLGYQRLLDGPGSRHEQWCSRTGKC